MCEVRVCEWALEHSELACRRSKILLFWTRKKDMDSKNTDLSIEGHAGLNNCSAHTSPQHLNISLIDLAIIPNDAPKYFKLKHIIPESFISCSHLVETYFFPQCKCRRNRLELSKYLLKTLRNRFNQLLPCSCDRCHFEWRLLLFVAVIYIYIYNKYIQHYTHIHIVYSCKAKYTI